MLGKIGVHLDTDAHCSQRIATGVQLSQRHHAELVGIFTSYDHPQCGLDTRGLPFECVAVLEASAATAQQQLRSLLDRAGAQSGVTVHWRAERGMPEDVLARNARYCDALMVTQPVIEESGPQAACRLFAAVVMAAGRPVIAVPRTWEGPSLGDRVVVSWDQSRAAIRSFVDAAPLLEASSRLMVLVINPESHVPAFTASNRDDLIAFCARRGLPAPEIVEHRSGNLGVAHTLIDAAAEWEADLIVMGAYGYSRLQAAILGGTTRQVLQHMQVPVLFSH
jgi:nucleotide-binding universal stress UspA family protein